MILIPRFILLLGLLYFSALVNIIDECVVLTAITWGTSMFWSHVWVWAATCSAAEEMCMIWFFDMATNSLVNPYEEAACLREQEQPPFSFLKTENLLPSSWDPNHLVYQENPRAVCMWAGNRKTRTVKKLSEKWEGRKDWNWRNILRTWTKVRTKSISKKQTIHSEIETFFKSLFKINTS